MASEGLVFLLVPLLERARYPIGYFFVDKINANAQVQLITQCLQLTGENGIHIVNITCDGCPANLSTLRILGADLPGSPTFKHPHFNQQVTCYHSLT